ncbi:MAG: peptidoglycan-binding protein, partial [Pseudomonadales bacterium]
MHASILQLASFLLSLGLALAAHGKDASDILETAQAKQLSRWEGVNVYVVDQTIMGHSARTYFQRFEVTDGGGESRTLFMPVSPDELTEGSCSTPRRMTADELDAFASGMEMTGAATAGGIEDGLAEAGLPRGLLGATGSDPSASLDPRVMMGGGATMMSAMAEHERARAADPNRATREATESANHMAEFYRTATLLGTESVDGRQAYRLEATGMNHVQAMDDGQFRMHTVTMWMDTEEHVPLRLRIEGEVTQGRETRAMSIEQHQSDFRKVPGSRLYEAHRRTMKIEGAMDAAQQAELEQSRQQLAELEEQMATMPASQRAMMEQMMGPQMEMIRNMASGGGFQTEIAVNAITVNPKTCGAGAVAALSAPLAATPTATAQAKAVKTSSNDGLVGMVQRDLTALGYDTGGASGEMNTATIVAISKFQAENGMEVTGEVTPQLAGILS